MREELPSSRPLPSRLGPQEGLLSEAERRIRNPRLVPPTIARNPPPRPCRGTPCSALGDHRSGRTALSMWWCRSTPAASLSVEGLLVRITSPSTSQGNHLGSHESLDIRPDDPNPLIPFLRWAMTGPRERGSSQTRNTQSPYGHVCREKNLVGKLGTRISRSSFLSTLPPPAMRQGRPRGGSEAFG